MVSPPPEGHPKLVRWWQSRPPAAGQGRPSAQAFFKPLLVLCYDCCLGQSKSLGQAHIQGDETDWPPEQRSRIAQQRAHVWDGRNWWVRCDLPHHVCSFTFCHLLPYPSLHWSALNIHTRCSLCLDAGSSASTGKLLCIFHNSVRGPKPSLTTHPATQQAGQGVPSHPSHRDPSGRLGPLSSGAASWYPSASQGPRMKGHCFGGWKERKEERKGERGKVNTLNSTP